MPGIYTHQYIFRKAAETVSKNSGRSYLLKSIALLLSYPEHMKAGLFGSIGPNIFDYMHPFRREAAYGSEISFYLHDRGYISFIEKMIDVIMESGDYRNEWVSAQRAYLLGYVSHIISDSIIHPYIFYSSGFADRESPGNADYYRRRNLRFQYNIDNYFIYRDEESVQWNLDVHQMVPSADKAGENTAWLSMRSLILESLKRDNPDIFRFRFKKIEHSRIDGSLERIPGFDDAVRNILLCYRVKRTVNEREIKFIDRLNESRLTSSDFFVRYPLPKRVDDDALNIHQGRWQYPALQRGFRYDSVLHLVRDAVERTAAAWEVLESMVYTGKKPDLNELNLLNAYTGEKDAFYADMKIKDPVKLKV